MKETAFPPFEDADQGDNLLLSLPAILWQRRWLIIVPAVVIALGAIAAAFLLPRTYRSSATLLVQSQDLPGTAGAVDDDPIDRRMAKIRQQILARSDIVALIQANDLYDASSRSEPLSKLVDRVRDHTNISAVDADVQRAGGGSNKGSIAFQLYFDYPEPDKAQIVAQAFVDRLLKLAASSTQVEAQTNVSFLEDQENQLKGQLAGIESEINRIAGANGAALSQGSIGLIGLGGGTDYASQIAALKRENAQLSAQTGVAVERDPGVIGAQAALAAAKAQYADGHPDVRLAEARLAAARSNAKQLMANGVSSVVKQQIDANNRAISDLERQRATEQGRLSALAAAQAQGPRVAQQVQQLQAQAETVRQNLSRVSASLLTARSMSKLADQQRGERLTLVEPPITPDTPSWPNRPLLIAGGIAGGLVVGLALGLLAEMFLQPIRTPAQITRLVGEPPLIVVPVLAHDWSTPQRRSNWSRWFGWLPRLRLRFWRRQAGA